MTDTLTIAQFIANRRKYLLRNREPFIKDKIIGFMDSVSSHVKAAAKLTNVIQIKSKQEINQQQYLKGLAIKHIDEIATKLHRFTHNQSKPSIFLWEFTLYSLISPQVIITHKNPSKISGYSNIWSCKNKLTIKRHCMTELQEQTHPSQFNEYIVRQNMNEIRQHVMNFSFLKPNEINSPIDIVIQSTETHTNNAYRNAQNTNNSSEPQAPPK
eukprot:622928_1